MNIYDVRRVGAAVFLVVAAVVVVAFLWVSNSLVADLAAQERERMQIWADATKEIADIATDTSETDDAYDAYALETSSHLDFLLSIVEQNHTIPVLLTDNDGNILMHRNFDLPEPVDSLQPYLLSEANERFLRRRLHQLEKRANVIHIVISADNLQHLYYDDSSLLRRLSFYPYVQVLVMLAFIGVVYWAVSTSKRAEQNKVWVGLSKETAHQLGTPISSLMAWMELLPELGVDASTVGEMNKDVARLSTIASRFSKIGSRPQMERCDLGEAVSRACGYMATRISSRIELTVNVDPHPLPVMACPPLLEWVMENLIKNAVDAMDGAGSIHVTAVRDGHNATVTVTDTGKGISAKNRKNVFNPGYTTKRRGWGLGLTLARRIVSQYHRGRIFVAWSEPGRGTTFQIEIPLLEERLEIRD